MLAKDATPVASTSAQQHSHRKSVLAHLSYSVAKAGSERKTTPLSIRLQLMGRNGVRRPGNSEPTLAKHATLLALTPAQQCSRHSGDLTDLSHSIANPGLESSKAPLSPPAMQVLESDGVKWPLTQHHSTCLTASPKPALRGKQHLSPPIYKK